jgi:ligand-binding SRPBCC domain-containing protein
MLCHFEAEQWIPVATEEVFRFFANPDNLPRIMPPASGTRLLHVKVVPPPDSPSSPPQEVFAGVGSEIVTSFRIIPFLPLRRKWIARITEFSWNHYFADVQAAGPFKSFHHRHELRREQRANQIGTVIRDSIDYEVGFGPLDRMANIIVSRQLKTTFNYRQRALGQLLVRTTPA